MSHTIWYAAEKESRRSTLFLQAADIIIGASQRQIVRPARHNEDELQASTATALRLATNRAPLSALFPRDMAVEDTVDSYLDTLEGEITFFRSIMRARPIGIHRHFHMLVIRNAIHRDTGNWVPVDEIWTKLRKCYDMDALEAIVRVTLSR